ncbi:MAG: nucleotide-binding protein [Candidatus Caenarcaniphilales bacterium]|nr:nucleotide-binding protein [Candidatus Caenarcaniphilales bacterium]NQY80129.1 nucleotide-binding protein [Candidatus Caenarcaniphilales bacterium]
MTLKYRGSKNQLQTIISSEFTDVSIEDQVGKVKFTFPGGQIINWWESKGTLQIQGTPDDSFNKKIQMLIDKQANITKTNKVFVVYGHDEAARRDLDGLLRRWKLDPVILDQLPSEGQTIIEKLEKYCLDQNVEYGIVLATPDDEGFKADHPDEKAYRVRQNVVLELGMLLGRLGRKKVAVLIKNQDKMDRPSDISGVIYIPFKDDLQKEVQVNLAKEMNTQGFNINLMDL